MSAPTTDTALPPRLVSLDAYRGFVMLAMASDGLGLADVAQHFPESRLWQFLSFHSNHVPWSGCSFWDLIQPSFMFMVGVSLPFSYSHRRARGATQQSLARHAVYRSFILVLLGVFLYSMGRSQTNFVFVNVLAQIGLGYSLLFLLLRRPMPAQVGIALLILVGYWYAFYRHPLPPADFDLATVGGLQPGKPYTGLFAHWNKGTNFAADFDRWFLNLFPRHEPFLYNVGGYQTLNFVPSLATMTFGLLAGQLLVGPRSQREKLHILIVAGTAALALGILLGQTVCPIVKRIWTPSWTFYSAGWACWMLAAFYALIDCGGYRKWAFPLVIVGMNSIAIYMLSETLRPFILGTLRTHLGQERFTGLYGPLTGSAAVLLVLWLICWWLYRQRIFIRI